MIFTAGGSAHIQKLVDDAALSGTRTATVTGDWEIDTAVRLPSHFTLILSDCHLRLKDGTYTNIFVNAHHETPEGNTAAGTDYEVRGVRESHQRHYYSRYEYEDRREVANFVRGLVKHREERREYRHYDTAHYAEEHGKVSHLKSVILRGFDIAASELLSDDNAHGFTRRYESNCHKIPKRRLDGNCGDRAETSVGVALV